MKKVLAFIVLLFSLCSPGFSQSLVDMDGNAWVSMPTPLRYVFIEGYLTANITALSYFYHNLTDKDGETPEAMIIQKKLEDFLLYKESIPYILSVLNDFYSDPDNKKFLIWNIFPQLFSHSLKVEMKDYKSFQGA